MKKAFIVTGFRDAGTEQEFAAGAIEQIEDGAFENYKAAGLVRAPTAEETAKATDTKVSTGKSTDPKGDGTKTDA
jgi:hypothetical protein